MRGACVTREELAWSDPTIERRATITDGARPATSPVSTDSPATYNNTRVSMRHLRHAEQPWGRKCDERVEARAGEKDPERSSHQRQEHAFNQQLTDDRTARRPEGRPDSDFLLSRGRSRNQQVRDVEACDRQQYTNGDVEDDERVFDLAGKLLAQWHEPGRSVPVELVCRGQAICDLIHISASRLDAGSRFHSSDDADESPAALAPWRVPVELKRDPGIVVVIHEAKSRRHHTHYLCRSVVQLDKVAYEVSITTKVRLPQAMTDDGEIRRIRAIVVFVERAAKDRCNTKHRKKLRRDRLQGQSRRFTGACQDCRRPGAHAATRSSVRLSRCQSSQVAGETELWLLLFRDSYTITRFSPSGYGSGRNSN